MERTIRNTKLAVWVLVGIFLIIAGIGAGQEDFGNRAILLCTSLIPTGPAILIASWIHDQNTDLTND